MIYQTLESYWIKKRERWMNDMMLQIFSDILSISIKAIPFIFVLLLVTVLFQKRVNPLIIEGIWFLVFLRLVIPASLPIQLNTIKAENVDSNSILVESFSDYYIYTGNTTLRLKERTDTDNVNTLPIENTFNVKEELDIKAFPWKSIIPLIWLIGCLFIILRAIYKANTFRKILNRDYESSIFKNSFISVIETSFVEYPIIFGCIKPQIYVPQKLWSTLSDKERKYILLHEMGHYKRNDILSGWLCYFVLSIHWFNPMVWLSFLVIQNLKEIACDRYVISKLPVEESFSYARTLLTVSEVGCSNYSNLSAAGMAGKSPIKRRIEMIVNNKKKKVIWSFVTLVLITTVILMFLTDPFSGGYYKSEIIGRTFAAQKYDYKTEYPFKKDKKLIGTWLKVDEGVWDIDNFRSPKSDFIKYNGERYIIFKKDGTTSDSTAWTRGLVINKAIQIAREYEIREIDGSQYLILENMSNTGFGTPDPGFFDIYLRISDKEVKDDLYIPSEFIQRTEIELLGETLTRDITREDIISRFGKPTSYKYVNMYSGINAPEDKLPPVYIMQYPGRFNINIIHGHIDWVDILGPKISVEGLELGMTSDEVFTIIPKPLETIIEDNQDHISHEIKNGTFIKNPEIGMSMYWGIDDGLVLFFNKNSLSELILEF